MVTHGEPAEHNKRVVSMLIEAISGGNIALIDERYTGEAAAKARQWSLFPMSRWTSSRRSLMATPSLQGVVVPVPILVSGAGTPQLSGTLNGLTRCTSFLS